MKTEDFCDMYNSFTGESGMMSGIDNPKQLKKHVFTGEELMEFVEHCLSQRPTLSHGEVMEVLMEFASAVKIPRNTTSTTGRTLTAIYDSSFKVLATTLCQLAPKQVSEVPDDIREFIGQVVYDGHGQMIFRGADKNNLKQFLDVRGWGSIQNMGFKTPAQSEAFQDKIGQWVTDVINDRLQSLTPEPKEPSQWISVEDDPPYKEQHIFYIPNSVPDSVFIGMWRIDVFQSDTELWKPIEIPPTPEQEEGGEG